MSTGIEWTDVVWNPVIGCTPVSPGCLNCYAATMANRLRHIKTASDYAPRLGADGQGKNGQPIRIAEVKNGRAVFTGEVRCLPHKLDEPLHWRTPRRVFVNSMSDLFHESVPFEFIDRVFAVMSLCPRHTFQVLTKRPERMAEYLDDDHSCGMGHRIAQCAREIVGRSDLATWVTGRTEQARDYFDDHEGILPNVWLGTSVEDQARADERIPHLLRCPATVRFLSCEPLLGPVDLSAFCGGRYVGLPGDVVHPNYNFGLGWVIVGGESGPQSRPCSVDWIRSIVKQCVSAGVPCFVKQLGSVVHDDQSEGVVCHIWPLGLETLISGPLDKGWRVRLRDPKGGDMAEWPEDLRVRQWPEVAR